MADFAEAGRLQIEDRADDVADLAHASERVQLGQLRMCFDGMHWRLDDAGRNGIHSDATLGTREVWLIVHPQDHCLTAAGAPSVRPRKSSTSPSKLSRRLPVDLSFHTAKTQSGHGRACREVGVATRAEAVSSVCAVV
jgi:hypothetical protein